MSAPLSSSAFNPQKAYLAPIGLFAQDLLGQDIAGAIAESAQIQALLIVMGRYMVLPENLTADEAAKYKSDQLFQRVFKQAAVLEEEISDMVPPEHDLATVLKEARTLVDHGQGVPDVPPFGLILSKKLPRDTVNQSLQVQAGLRILAITDNWPGRDRIVPPRLFDNDPAELNRVQGVLVHVHSQYLTPLKDGSEPSENMTASLALARDVAVLAINNAHDMLGLAGYDDAAANLAEYQQQKPDSDYASATQHYWDAISNGPAPQPGVLPKL